MGGGMFLMVVGAILAFAVDDDVPGINLTITGLILMLAGVAAIAHARRGVEREREVTTVDDQPGDGSAPHVVRETVREHDSDPHRI
ncbi:MAG: DUF6458 family protein [Nocardioides sp.]